jgi:spore maturation protein CgeB
MKVVFVGLSITSSWGNGHATNYRALVRELGRRGHDVLFCERDVPWYASARDLPLAGERTLLYGSLDELADKATSDVRDADLTIVGSYVPEGVAVAEWVFQITEGATAFYDLDTPVTIGKLERGDHEYLTPGLIPRFDHYLSFTGGPMLRLLEERYGARRAISFYCLVDPEAYRPTPAPLRWDLGYLGTYSDDRQPTVHALLIEPAQRLHQRAFAVAGPQYPERISWPPNVERIEHVGPVEHAAFYGAQRFTLNVTRREMRAAGWSPSVRLFEAAACGVPIISDVWPGLEEVLVPEAEILLARTPDDVERHLVDMSEPDRLALADRARSRVLAAHTARQRCELLEGLVLGTPV